MDYNIHVAFMGEKVKNNSNKKKYLIYFAIIIVATTISLITSLWGQFSQVIDVLGSANIGWVAFMIFLVFSAYFIEALVIKLFCRLYTRKYSIFQGLATSLTGQFFSDVTPGASGGQVMQAYTLKNQGIPVSSGASIFVMQFILYQVSLIIFDLVALIVERDQIFSITTVRLTGNTTFPMAPVIIFGFGLNLAVTGLIYLLSYSRHFHNFVLKYVLGLLAKLRLIKDLEKSRSDLKSTVENYKIELKRLHSNLPLTIVVVCLNFCLIFIRDSIPYFSGLALSAWSDSSFQIDKLFDAAFLGSFHQMVTGLIPLPGSALVSEYFFEILFYNFYGPTYDVGGNIIRTATVNVASAQILWRISTFHFMLLISGVFVALYRNKPKEGISHANRKTFVTLQISTIQERNLSFASMLETKKIKTEELKAESASRWEKLKNRSEQRRIEREQKKSLVSPKESKVRDNRRRDEEREYFDINL